MWAAAAGLTFGFFQAVNRVSIVKMDVYESTFIQLAVSLVVLVVYLVANGDIVKLRTIPGSGYLYFALSGGVHFIAGWTLLNQSQKLLGAARTSPLLASTPLFGTLLAVVTLGELPNFLSLLGMATIIGGVTLVHLDRIRREARFVAMPAGTERSAGGAGGISGEGGPRRRGAAFYPLFGLGAALAWAVSPIFIRRGLAVADRPLLGVAIGIFAATVIYGCVLIARRQRFLSQVGMRALLLKILAGVLVGFATVSRWYALSVVEVTVVLSLGLLSVPTVMVFARLIASRQLERATSQVLAGAALVVAGALILILPRVGGSS